MVNVDYGNWVPKRIIYGSVIIGVLFLIVAIWFQYLLITAILFFVIAAFFVYARYKFSASVETFSSLYGT
ncbi:MAG: hypothetical protein QCH99_04380 [Candidatus Bathyarchaeota archaeon]|nr:hypothetical protein [Candidatus Bathyarchaeum tardum]